MAANKPLELGYQGRVASERQSCVDPVLGACSRNSSSRSISGAARLLVRHLRVRASPPQAERLVQEAGGPLGLPDCKRPLPRGRQCLELADVDVLDAEHVARCPGRERVRRTGLPERLSQAQM